MWKNWSLPAALPPLRSFRKSHRKTRASKGSSSPPVFFDDAIFACRHHGRAKRANNFFSQRVSSLSVFLFKTCFQSLLQEYCSRVVSLSVNVVFISLCAACAIKKMFSSIVGLRYTISKGSCCPYCLFHTAPSSKVFIIFLGIALNETGPRSSQNAVP